MSFLIFLELVCLPFFKEELSYGLSVGVRDDYSVKDREVFHWLVILGIDRDSLEEVQDREGGREDLAED